MHSLKPGFAQMMTRLLNLKRNYNKLPRILWQLTQTKKKLLLQKEEQISLSCTKRSWMARLKSLWHLNLYQVRRQCLSVPKISSTDNTKLKKWESKSSKTQTRISLGSTSRNQVPPKLKTFFSKLQSEISLSYSANGELSTTVRTSQTFITEIKKKFLESLL